MNKSEKIHALHRLLANAKYPVPLNRILDEMGNCSRQTFFRIRREFESSYRTTIEECGDGRYRYSRAEGAPVMVPGVWFSREELEALLCLDHVQQQLHGGVLSETLAPLRQKMREMLSGQGIAGPAWAERIRMLPLARRPVEGSVFKTVADAVLRQVRMRILYTPLHAVEGCTREVSPQTMLLYRDNWYLDAWCHNRNALRVFALSRIHTADVLAAAAKSIARSRLDRHFATAYGIFSGTPTETARIRFTGIAAREVAAQSWHPRQKIRHLSPDTIEIAIPCNNTTELIMDVLKWGDNAEVIAPPALRTAVAEIVEKCAKKYAGSLRI